MPGGAWVWEGSRVQLLGSCERESVSRKLKKQPSSNGQLCCCWDISSVWCCFCPGFPSLALTWHPAKKWEKHLVLSSAVRQGKGRALGVFVCLGPARVWCEWWAEYHLKCTFALSQNRLCGPQEKPFSAPSLCVSRCSPTARLRLHVVGRERMQRSQGRSLAVKPLTPQVGGQ